VTEADDAADRDWLARKIAQLRIFDDDAGRDEPQRRRIGRQHPCRVAVHAVCVDAQGQPPVLQRGGAPRGRAAGFDAFVAVLADLLGKPVPTGVFGANMQVRLVNDGPVTIWIDSKQRE
jgi:D-tyrosyl-tRNA(Tyr) deacylase